MKRNGFILVETVIVLVIVIVSMLGLYKAYSFVSINLKQNRYYDNMNDIYKANIIKKAFIDGLPTGNYIKLTSSNCGDYISEDCEELYTLMGIDYVIVSNIEISSILSGSHTGLSNTDLNYIKYLPAGYKYLMISYEKDNHNYYASLSTGEI